MEETKKPSPRDECGILCLKSRHEDHTLRPRPTIATYTPRQCPWAGKGVSPVPARGCEARNSQRKEKYGLGSPCPESRASD